MFTVGGVPLHPLVTHAVVVLLPLATLGAVTMAVRPLWRRQFGIPVLLIALAGGAAVPLATRTGEQLQASLPGPNPLIQQHAVLGDSLLPFAAGFVVLLLLTVIADRRVDRPAGGAHGRTAVRGRSRTAAVATALAVLSVLAGAWVTYLVIRIGHSGATAVWQS